RTGTEFPPSEMTVHAGISNVRAPEAIRQTAAVADVVPHPYYVYGTNGVAPDDVARLELATPLDLSDDAVQPIPLTTGGPQPAPGTAGYISGFGRQAAGADPDGQLY